MGSFARARASVALAGLAVLVVASGCGDGDPPPPVDASADRDAGTVDAMIPPPAAPAPPVLTPCPAGWREEVHAAAAVTVCRPWPETGPAACAPYEGHFPGEPGCARVGAACAADGWPAGLPSTGVVVHVRAGATGGSGTRADPYGTIAQATTGATPGTVIALAEGAYLEDVTLGAGVSLVGACPERTILTSATASSSAGAITITGKGAAVRDLTLEGGPRVGLWLAGPVSARVDGVVIREVGWVGINVERGARLDARDVVVRDLPGAPGTGLFGRALTVESGSSATVERFGSERARGIAVLAVGEGTTLTLRDAVVRETLGQPSDGDGGIGLAAFDGAHIEATAVVLEQNAEAGVFANRTGAAIDIEHGVVTDMRPNAVTSAFGRGLIAQAGGVASCRRCLFERALEAGVFAGGDGASVELVDSVVAESRPEAVTGKFGRGVLVQLGAIGRVERVVIADCLETGLLVGGAGASANIADLLIRGTRSEESSGYYGRAIAIQAGAQATLARIRIEDNSELGLFVASAGTVADATDLDLRDVGPQSADGRFGRGILTQFGASLTVTRARVELTHELGLTAMGEGARITARDVTVHVVASQTCAETTCADMPGGHGIGAYRSAQIAVEGFSVDSAAICGVHVALDGLVALHSGVVSGCAIGACLQSDAQSLSDLMDGVVYRDNALPLDSTTLPVPDVVAVVDVME